MELDSSKLKNEKRFKLSFKSNPNEGGLLIISYLIAIFHYLDHFQFYSLQSILYGTFSFPIKI